jgi:hypothetical protein
MEPVTLDLAEVVYTMPVLPDFATTHQWVREMRHWNGGRVLGVHVRVTRATVVYVGRFGGPHFALPIGDACRWVTAHPEGAEILVPRSFSAKEILAFRPIVPLVGWRETPANDRSWSCLCDGCVPRGTPNLQRRLLAAIAKNLYDARIAAQADDIAAVVAALARCVTPLERLRSPAHVLARADFARFVGARPFATASKFPGGGVARDGGPTLTGARPFATASKFPGGGVARDGGPTVTGNAAVDAAVRACLAFFPAVASD